jgi:hypothetical protein
METPQVNVTPPPPLEHFETPVASPSPFEEGNHPRLRKKLFQTPPLKLTLLESPMSSKYNQNGTSPVARQAEEGSNAYGTFQAVKLYKNEFHFAYEKLTVAVDNRTRTLNFRMNRYKDERLTKQFKQIMDPGFKTPRMNVRETLKIDFDEISGLDFQYAPCEDVIVVIELFKKKIHDNPLLW